MTIRDFLALQDNLKLTSESLEIAQITLRKIDDALEEIEQTIHVENAETIAVIRGWIDACLVVTSSQ